jgi:hypothetical protein
MAKSRGFVPDVETGWLAAAFHFGGLASGPGHPWHLVWQWQLLDLPPGGTYISIPCLDEPSAILAARSLTSLPLIVRDLCPFCWDDDIFKWYTPSTPRWNIYRGQTHVRVIPCIYWDLANEDPPPGFQWDGS